MRDHAPDLNITTPPDFAFPKFQLAESSKHLFAQPNKSQTMKVPWSKALQQMCNGEVDHQ